MISGSGNAYKDIMQIIHEPVMLLDSGLRVIYANSSLFDHFNVTSEETIGKLVYDIGGRQWDIPEIRTLLEDIISNRNEVGSYSVETDFSGLGRRTIMFTGSRTGFEEVGSRLILLTLEDITERIKLRKDTAPLAADKGKTLPAAAPESTEDNSFSVISEHLLFEIIMDNSLDQIYFKDKDTRFIYVNKKYALNRGVGNPADVLGKTEFDYLSKNDAKITTKDDKFILKTGKPIIGKIEKLTMLDGTAKWISVSKYPLNDKSGNIVGIWGISRDVTDNERAKEALRASEARNKAMIANISDVISIIQPNGLLIFVSPNIEKWFGWTPEDIIGAPAWAKLHPDCRENITKELFSLLEKDRSSKTGELRFMCKGGRYKYVELTAINLINDPNIKGVLVNYHDITERKEKEEKIVYLNYHDVLTGLYNRAFFEEEIKRLDTERQMPLSIIMGDINGLKLINDGFGHAQGDKVLVEIAKILLKCCRKEDIVARISGDEFCILLPQTDAESAQAICRRIYKACEEYESEMDRETYFASISLGCAAKTNPSQSVDSILKSAEDIMYRHKLLERKSMHSSIISSIKMTMLEKSPEMEEHSERLVEISRTLGQALNLTDGQLYDLGLLSTLYDIGKMSIDDRILSKNGKLTETEWLEIKRHPEVGYRIAMASQELISIADYILCHHESWDGSGYPQGLLGKAIPLLSRIIAVTDAYDAMTHGRPYREALSKEAALAEIVENTGTKFDPEIARIFVEFMRLNPQE